jgi:hypothetical protein
LRRADLTDIELYQNAKVRAAGWRPDDEYGGLTWNAAIL